MSGFNREQWLEIAIAEIGERALNGNLVMSEVKVSCGFPPGTRGTRSYAVLDPSLSDARKYEVFISPGLDKPCEVLESLHKAACEITSHRYDATDFTGLAEDLGPYPHAKVTRRKAGPTRLVKCECPTCDYGVWTTQKHLNKGTPQCPNMICDSYQQTMDVMRKAD